MIDTITTDSEAKETIFCPACIGSAVVNAAKTRACCTRCGKQWAKSVTDGLWYQLPQQAAMDI